MARVGRDSLICTGGPAVLSGPPGPNRAGSVSELVSLVLDALLTSVPVPAWSVCHRLKHRREPVDDGGPDHQDDKDDGEDLLAVHTWGLSAGGLGVSRAVVSVVRWPDLTETRVTAPVRRRRGDSHRRPHADPGHRAPRHYDPRARRPPGAGQCAGPAPVLRAASATPRHLWVSPEPMTTRSKPPSSAGTTSRQPPR